MLVIYGLLFQPSACLGVLVFDICHTPQRPTPTTIRIRFTFTDYAKIMNTHRCSFEAYTPNRQTKDNEEKFAEFDFFFVLN